MTAWNDPPLSMIERFTINAIGWTLTLLAIPFGSALIGMFIDGMAVHR